MPLIKALILGIVQGLTEFLPVSSSAHLIIFPDVLGWGEHSLSFDTTLHLGTLSALLVVFRKDILSIIKSLFSDIKKHKKSFNHYSSNSWLSFKIIIASIPVGLIGLLFEDILEDKFRGIWFVIIFLLVGTLIMYIAEKRFKKRLIVKDEISVGKSFKVGVFQALALLPGISRSGSTISGGMLFGLSRKEATRFSFLLSIPAVLAAGVFQIYSSLDYLNMAEIAPMIVGFISSFLVGIIAINFMMKFVKNNKLYPFIFYRLGLAVFLIILFYI